MFERIVGVSRYLVARDGENLISLDRLAELLSTTADAVADLCEAEGASLVGLTITAGIGRALFLKVN